MKSKKIYPVSRGGWRVTEWQLHTSEWNAIEFLDMNEYQVLEGVCKKIQDTHSIFAFSDFLFPFMY